MLLGWLKVFLFFEHLHRLEQTSAQTCYASSTSVVNDHLQPQHAVFQNIHSHPGVMHMCVKSLVFLLLWQIGVS